MNCFELVFESAFLIVYIFVYAFLGNCIFVFAGFIAAL